MLFTPSPVTNCHTFSDPLERDVLYGRPLLQPRTLVTCVWINIIFHSLLRLYSSSSRLPLISSIHIRHGSNLVEYVACLRVISITCMYYTYTATCNRKVTALTGFYNQSLTAFHQEAPLQFIFKTEVLKINVARMGIEPTTFALLARRSNQLS